MKPRTADPLSDQQHEPWMAEEREDRADLMRAPDSIPGMEGHMVEEVEAREGRLPGRESAEAVAAPVGKQGEAAARLADRPLE